jgi:hypothetical protein
MRENAVILTYPGHFHLTQLTIRSVREHIQPKDITVIVDDWSFLVWDGYVEDCKQTYTNCNIIHTSQFEFLKPFEGNSWMRQQMIKLNLHKILDFNDWFFTDGDIEFYHDIPKNITPYSVRTIPMSEWEVYSTLPLADRGTELMANYVNNMLGLSNFWDLPAPFIKEGPNRVISSSGVPFRDMNKHLLEELEQFLTTKFNTDLATIHVAVMKDNTQAMTEWELMEAYRKYIRKEDLIMVRFLPHNKDHIEEAKRNLHIDAEEYYYLMHFLPDSDLGPNWFAEQGIKINEEIWQKIPQKRY